MRHKQNLREIGTLSTAERIRGHIERFVGQESHYLELMAQAERRRRIRQAMDEDEQEEEQQLIPDDNAE